MPKGASRPARTAAAPRSSTDYETHRMVMELSWLRTMAHLAPVGIFRCDADGICTYVNDRWSEQSGYTASFAIGKPWSLAVYPEDIPQLEEEAARAAQEGRQFRLEHRYRQPNGRIVWVLAQVSREVDGAGRTVGYTGVTTDVTELRKMREELQHANRDLELRMQDRSAELQRMARIVETIDDAVVSADLAGRILSWNSGAEKIFGYSAAEIVGQPVEVLAPATKLEEVRMFEEHLRTGGEFKRFESLAITKAGQIIEIAVSGFPLRDPDGAISGTWVIVRDITARKTAERRLQRLSRRLLTIQDDERRRIARDLHDSTAQSLAALAMHLSALARDDSPLSEARRRQMLADCAALASQATSELRTTSYLLHPPLLDERGLHAAISWLVSGFSARSGIEVKLDLDPEFERLPTEVEIALFRVVQESLHNVHRHSGSKRAAVSLTRENQLVKCSVRDFGKGADPEASVGAGVGISGMRERLFEFGGSLALHRADPGLMVVASLPLD